MSKDKLFGVFLVLAGFASAVFVGMFFTYSGESIPVVMLAIPSAVVLLGLVLIFFNFVEDHLEIDDEIEQFSELIEDDIEALREGQITVTHILLVATAFAFVSELLLLFMYRKWLANWGSINVLLIAVLVAIIGIYIGLKSEWFQRRSSRTPLWIFFIPMGGFLICALLGMYYTEPGGYLPVNRADYEYRYEETRASGITIFQSNYYNFGGSASDVDIDCDGDECGYLLLAVVLIIVVIICIVGSVFIPHFWVLATILLLALMGLVALRELLYSDNHRPRYWW